jgi:hypothetical protein
MSEEIKESKAMPVTEQSHVSTSVSIIGGQLSVAMTPGTAGE